MSLTALYFNPFVFLIQRIRICCPELPLSNLFIHIELIHVSLPVPLAPLTFYLQIWPGQPLVFVQTTLLSCLPRLNHPPLGRPERLKPKARFALSQVVTRAGSVERYVPCRSLDFSTLPSVLQKCDERPNEVGQCETCVRLRVECLGFGTKRPEWLRVSFF